MSSAGVCCLSDDVLDSSSVHGFIEIIEYSLFSVVFTFYMDFS